MKPDDLLALVASGEDSLRQFKAIVRRTPQVTPQVLQMLGIITGDMARLRAAGLEYFSVGRANA